jgi:hypothetical protein
VVWLGLRTDPLAADDIERRLEHEMNDEMVGEKAVIVRVYGEQGTPCRTGG